MINMAQFEDRTDFGHKTLGNDFAFRNCES